MQALRQLVAHFILKQSAFCACKSEDEKKIKVNR